MISHPEIIHWGNANPPDGAKWCHECHGYYMPRDAHANIHHKEDYQARDGYTVPKTHMSIEESAMLVELLHRLPSNTGFLISHCVEPPHTPVVWGGYSAKVILPNGGSGEASHNNPALAFREAWAKAHRDQAEMIGLKEGEK